MEKSTVVRGGRPPQGPISGKGATLATRITPELRRALDEEAEVTGRSVSQVAELALRQWHDRNKLAKASHGSISAAITKLEQIASAIQDAIPDERTAYFATANTWKKAIFDVLGSAPISAPMIQEIRSNGKLVDLLHAIAKRIDASASDNPMSIQAKTPSHRHDSCSIYELMTEQAGLAVTSRLDELVASLEQLKTTGETANGEIQKAIVLARDLQEVRARDEAAEDAGNEIADLILEKMVGAR